jgi:hypothetical protein
MGEFRDRLDAEAKRVSADPDRFGQVIERARRRRIRRQVTSGVLALAIAGGSFALAYGAFRGPGSARPVAGASPSAISSVQLRLLDGADDPYAMDAARGLIRMAGFKVVEEGEAGHAYETTTIACPLDFDDEAARLAKLLGVEAAIVPALPNPDYDLTVYIGEDFSTPEHVRLLTWIAKFVEARQEGNAERILAPSARDDYFETSGRTEPRFGELYLHPEQGTRFRVTSWDKLNADTWSFDLQVVWESPCPRLFIERITIAVVGDGRYELTSASLAGAPVSDCPT